MIITSGKISFFAGNIIRLFEERKVDSLDALFNKGGNRFDVGSNGCRDILEIGLRQRNGIVQVSYKYSEYRIGIPLRIDVGKNSHVEYSRFTVICRDDIEGYQTYGNCGSSGNRVQKKTISRAEMSEVAKELESLREG